MFLGPKKSNAKAACTTLQIWCVLYVQVDEWIKTKKVFKYFCNPFAQLNEAATIFLSRAQDRK